MGSDKGRDGFGRGNQFEGDRLATKGQVGQKLAEDFPVIGMIRGQRDDKLAQCFPCESLWFRLSLLRQRNIRDRFA